MSRVGMVLRRSAIGCVLVVLCSSSAAADPVRFSLVERRVQGEVGALTDFGRFTSDVADGTLLPGLFNADFTVRLPPEGVGSSVASLSLTQHTDVSVTGWSGSGTVKTQAVPAVDISNRPAGGVSGESMMTTAFTLTEPMSYRFSGTVFGEGTFSSVALADSNGALWAFGTSEAVPHFASHSGLLSPGDYLFRASALSVAITGFELAGGPGGTSSWDVQFTLTDPVPEPTTLLLFGTGAAVVGRTAWRRRREQPETGSSDSIGEA